MGFERFTKIGRGYRPKVSIWSRGQIGFNQGAVEKFDLQKYKYVVFFYDKENKRIGFKFTNDENEEGISKISLRKTGTSASARSFLGYYSIDHEKTKSYNIKFDEDSNLYTIELPKD